MELTSLLLQTSFSLFRFSDPCSSHDLQWLTECVNALQIPFMVCEYLIWPVQTESNDLCYCCRRIFAFSATPLAGPTDWPWVRFFFSILQTSLLVSKWLSYPLKLMAFTYPSVADSIFCISPSDLLQLPILSNSLWYLSALCRCHSRYVGTF